MTEKKTPFSEIFNRVTDAKSAKDLEAASDLAAEMVVAGMLTQAEVDFIFEDCAPDLYY